MGRFSFDADTSLENIVYETNQVRIALLTSRLLRVETGAFTDMPTQTVWNRNLGKVTFSIETQGESIAVKTADATFVVNKSNVGKNDISKTSLTNKTLNKISELSVFTQA